MLRLGLGEREIRENGGDEGRETVLILCIYFGIAFLNLNQLAIDLVDLLQLNK